MKPYYEKDGIVYHGDARDVLRTDRARRLLLTDPPDGVEGSVSHKTQYQETSPIPGDSCGSSKPPALVPQVQDVVRRKVNASRLHGWDCGRKCRAEHAPLSARKTLCGRSRRPGERPRR